MTALYPVPRVLGVSELRCRQKEIIDQLSDGPVVLAQNNQPAAVLVDVAQWNGLLEELADLRDTLLALERLAETQNDPSCAAPLSEVLERLAGAGSADA